MTNLDKKLKDILEEAQSYIDDTEVKSTARISAVAQIKQAFADEGWDNYRSKATFGEPLMSGSEWYERFVQALDDEFHQFSKPSNIVAGAHYDAVNVHKAAKKASGL